MYPPEEQVSSTISFQKLENNTIQATLTAKRNDPQVNSLNRVMLQHWRANVDLQVIVDVEACVRYMFKYAAKSEPRSQPIQSLYKSSVSHLLIIIPVIPERFCVVQLLVLLVKGTSVPPKLLTCSSAFCCSVLLITS